MVLEPLESMVASDLVFLERLTGKPRKSFKNETWDQNKKVFSFCCLHKEHFVPWSKKLWLFRKGDFGLMALADKPVFP